MTLLDELKAGRDREAARRPYVSPPALAAWGEAISIAERHAGRSTRRGRLLEQLVVAWCRVSRSHVIEPWIHLGERSPFKTHEGCPSCTWCVECGELLGRDEVGPI